MSLIVEKEKGPFWIKKRIDISGEKTLRVTLLKLDWHDFRYFWKRPLTLLECIFEGHTIDFNGKYGATLGGNVYNPVVDYVGVGETKIFKKNGSRFKVTGY